MIYVPRRTSQRARRLSSTRAHANDAARAAIRAMSGDPLTVALRVEIGLAALAGPELVRMFVEFADQDALHAGVLTQAASRFGAGLVRRDAAVLSTVRTGLRASRDDRLRRLALTALVGLARARGGWTDDRVAELQVWCKDPSPMVAEAAQFTFVANWASQSVEPSFAPLADTRLLPTRRHSRAPSRMF